MRTLIFSILALLLAIPASAAELMIIQSLRRDAYDQVARVLQNSCSIKSETMVMSDYSEFDLGRIVREEKPRFVIAIGEEALKEARKLRRVPVVYTMTLNVDENSLGNNVVGVTMIAAPKNYLKLFKQMHLRRIGILYDPRRTGAYLERAGQATAGFGIELIPIKVSSPREVLTALQKLKQSSVDGIWLLPDSTAVTPETIDAYFHFAQQQNLPLIGFARSYLEKGALAVLEVSRQMMGEQSCSLVRKLRAGMPVQDLTVVDVSEADLFTNKGVAARLKIELSGLEEPFSKY